VDAVTAFAFVIGMLALGRVLGATRRLPESAPDVLNAVVLNVCLPASVLLHAPRLDPSGDLARIAVVPWILLLLSAALVLALSRALHWDRATTGVLLLAVPLGNTAFLGYPLVGALLGESAMAPAVVYDQFGTFLALSTVGLAVVARYGDGERPDAVQMALRVLRFPPFIALLLALSVAPDAWPAPVEAVLRRLADALLPLVTLAIGIQVRLRLPRAQVAPLVAGLAAKLLLLPALSLALAAWLDLEGAAREAVVLQSAMPTMITAMALAAAARMAPALGAALVGYGIVLSIALLPAWLWLLR
jgi:predicted permease